MDIEGPREGAVRDRERERKPWEWGPVNVIIGRVYRPAQGAGHTRRPPRLILSFPCQPTRQAGRQAAYPPLVKGTTVEGRTSRGWMK